MKNLKISVVIPAYNEEEYLPACLNALGAQIVLPFEVIVVDNNSTDMTAAIAKSFPFVKLIQEPRQGRAYARKSGAIAASGDIIAQIDADTNVPPQWTKTIARLAESMPETDGMSGPCRFRAGKIAWLLFPLHRLVYFWSSWALMGHRTLFGSNMFLYRSNWQRIRDEVCMRTDIHEDMDWSEHIVKHGGKIRFDRTFWATTSPRRWANSLHYPKMWLKTKVIHAMKR